MAMFHLFKIRTSIDIYINEKCNVTFGLEYMFKPKRYGFRYDDLIIRRGFFK